MTLTEAKQITGGLSKPSKMPGLSYGISAKQCNVGSKLAKVPGSVCNGCYALKSNYQYPSVAAAHQKRLDGLESISWVDSMVKLISSSGEAYFRWHDSGDLQSLQHLLDIVRIAELLPNVSFWLPTKEKAILASAKRAESLTMATLSLIATPWHLEAIGYPGMAWFIHISPVGLRHSTRKASGSMAKAEIF